MRGHMYYLDRNSLTKIYTSYIRLIQEHGDIFWDNCSEQQKSDIAGVQFAVSRAISGAKRGTSHKLLYKDTMLKKVEDRR